MKHRSKQPNPSPLSSAACLRYTPDPAFAPGTGTPVVGGLSTAQALAILRGLGAIDWVGMDLVEVAPAYDVSDITALAAATLVFEYLALLAGRRA